MRTADRRHKTVPEPLSGLDPSEPQGFVYSANEYDGLLVLKVKP
jgi:hypothetical protein